MRIGASLVGDTCWYQAGDELLVLPMEGKAKPLRLQRAFSGVAGDVVHVPGTGVLVVLTLGRPAAFELSWISQTG